MSFDVPLSDLFEYLWGTMANKLGVRPSSCFQLYGYNIDLGVMLHPYDDRGMDVYGPNRDKISGLYAGRRDWLLDYDLTEMNRRYQIDAED